MRKFTNRLIAFLFFLVPLFAQAQAPVTGRVLDEKGQPVVGATVLVKGAKSGTKTDANGNFTITAKTGDVLVISSVNFGSQQTKVKDGGNVTVNMIAKDGTMDEVVVTAMDIKKAPRELGYSVQTVKGAEVAETQRENFINALQGRVAGLSVTPTTGTAGASSGIILRGFNTLSGTNQPLFIIDGIIVDNTTFNSNSQGGSGVGLASDGANRNIDNTNRIADLNPNDIESYTILKGPEATALYGSQASSGAIVITTKRAKLTGKKIAVTYDNNFRMQKLTRFAKVNNEYGPGASNGNPDPVGRFTSFGPKWPAGTQLYDNVNNFYETGFSQTHNLGLEFGIKNVSFRASGQYLNNSGVVPNNFYKKYSGRISNTTKIGKYITITPSVAYSYADNKKPTKGSSSYLMSLYQWPANNNIQKYQDDYGGKITLFNANPNADFDNPVWSTKNNIMGDITRRWIATMGIDIKPFEWLNVSGRFGYDTYKTDGYIMIHPQSFYLTAGTLGTLENYYTTYKGYNHTITASAKKEWKGFTARLLVGTMWQDFETQQYAVFGNRIADSIVGGKIYKYGNIVTSWNPTDSNLTAPGSRVRLQRAASKGLPNLRQFRELAYFGEVSLGYKNVAFLTYSQRFEKASPIPPKNNNYNYPGASMSLIMSDIFPILKKGEILDYFKLRASLANTARLNDPYTNQRVFVPNQSSSNNPGGTFTYSFTNNNPDLVPERQSTYEVGAELRFFNGRINLDAAYYNTLNTKQISQGFRASYATSAVLNTTNAASLRNEGVELTLNLSPIKKKNFNWTVNFNFSHMWSKVLTLPESIGPLNDYYNSDTYISNVRGGLIRGFSTGTITGSTYQRNQAGQILINAGTGLPLTNGGNQLIADRNPDFTLGTLNTFRYKNWTLSFLWDWKVGGDIYNGTDQVLTGIGKSARTANRNNAIVVEGVLNDGLQNTATPTRNTIAIIPNFLSTYYTTMPDEEFIEKDVNWFRLRDITLNYRFPEKLTKRVKYLKAMSFFITGNDLVLFTNYRGADPSINANNPGTLGVGGYGMDLGNAPTPIGMSFGLKASF
ncbi:MAG: SusC/RagA family TonB-linked outer membrane protein [Chitinophagaceae bacterium]|nr:SusC/RagA family TonB-linked outer membrane protein [Chitinophagaceae bacterium]MBK9485811.1 SusC/RagA family TonB-linked outer membrane protein [Chitinophagaceae bacterium]MBL0201115.1 SusC/RagA family TonB-linked outer membrane protein [Chitinophagaceae bacterium]